MTGWVLVSYAVMVGYVLWLLIRARSTCWHGPDHEDIVELPPECGENAEDEHVWFVCRQCGRKTVYTRAQVVRILKREEC